jgi:hypothetical protein
MILTNCLERNKMRGWRLETLGWKLEALKEREYRSQESEYRIKDLFRIHHIKIESGFLNRPKVLNYKENHAFKR